MNILVVLDKGTEFPKKEELSFEHDVSFASTLEEALSILETNALIDVVIVDSNLEDDSAFDLISKIRNTEYSEDLFVILLTDPDDYISEIEGLRRGADEYVRKPIWKESFLADMRLYQKFIYQRGEKVKFESIARIYDALFQQAPIGISISHSLSPLKGEGNEYFEANKNYLKITGRNRQELLELGWYTITHPDDRDKELALYKDMQEGKIDSYEIEKRYIKPDGSIVWVHLIGSTLDIYDHEENSYICIVEDITKRKEAERALGESERSKGVLLSNMPGLAYRCKYDKDWTMEFLSDKSKKILGYEKEQVLYNKEISYNEIIMPQYRENIHKLWDEKLRKGEPLELEYEIQTKNGEIKWIYEAGEGVLGENGEITHIEGMFFDITEPKQIEEELRFNTEHHMWTGLHNRIYFDNFYKRKVHSDNNRAIVLINMSNLLSLSMSYGFNYYKNMIKKSGILLDSYVNKDRQLFHISDNIFIYYMEKHKGREELEKFGREISRALDGFFALELIGLSVGIIEISPADSDDIDKCISNALIASEEIATNASGNVSYSFFDAEMENRILRKELIKQELAKIASGENVERLSLEFQPIIDLNDNDRIWGFEALARLRSNALGRISPLEFIPIAEETKLIIPLGEMILAQAFDFHKKMRQEGYENIFVSINLSAIQLREESFYKKLMTIVNNKSVDLEFISFEVTETSVIENYGEMNTTLAKLLSDGAEVAIDDFGTGYSSLARERELSVSCVKIDKFFIDRLLTHESFDDSIVGDVISMAHKLDNYVIAEGVENESQMEYLRLKGCDALQGYIISRPLKEVDALSFIKDYQPKGMSQRQMP